MLNIGKSLAVLPHLGQLLLGRDLQKPLKDGGTSKACKCLSTLQLADAHQRQHWLSRMLQKSVHFLTAENFPPGSSL